MVGYCVLLLSLLPMLAVSGAALAYEPPALDPQKGSGRSKKDAALVIAVEDYASIPDAAFAKADADAFTSFLVGNADVPANNVVRLDNPTAADIRSALVILPSRVRKNGTVWVYFAGHGGIAGDGDRIVFPHDVAPEFGGVDGVGLDDLTNAATGSKAARTVVVVDASFGGLGRNGEELFPGNRFAVLSPVPTPKDEHATLWTATSTGEYSASYESAGHSVFTYFAVGALRGWGDGVLGQPADGRVSLAEAQAYVNKQVRAIGGPMQKPVKETRPAVMDWALATKNMVAGPTKDELAELAEVERARRIRVATDALLAGATEVWQGLPTDATRLAALRSFVSRYDTASVVVDGVEVPVIVPEVGGARSEVDSLERAAAAKQGKKKKRGRSKTPPAPVPVVEAVFTAACDDLVRLEPSAMIGLLSNDDVTCLENRVAQESQQTARDKVSRVLMVNAEGRGDMAEWMRLASRHLEVVDRSDPDLCFRYALLLSRGEVEDAPAALRWADYALENKHVWQGPTYVQRVYALLGLRAQVASRLWLDAEEAYLDERTEENEADAGHWRGTAKDAAREWLDYARTSAQSTQQPGMLCRSAAGNENFCSASAPPVQDEAAAP